MIVIDTSALFAILAEEAEAEAFSLVIDAAPSASCAATVYVELGIAASLRYRRPMQAVVDGLLASLGVETAPVDAGLAAQALAAHAAFGKGQHPAALNLGDCFSYALAKSRGAPLLFKGDDFARTDIVPAWTAPR